jgi:hypothetical protein
MFSSVQQRRTQRWQPSIKSRAFSTVPKQATHLAAAGFAVPNHLLGKRFGPNYSSVSFGSNQLDIGENPIAQQAYERIVTNAFDTGAIGQEQKARLLSYSGLRRPDLGFIGGLDSPTRALPLLQSDRRTLDGLFSTPYARNEIVKASHANIATQLTPINNLLDRLTSAFQNDPNSIFNPTSPDYHTAVAAMIAAYNRGPGLANRLATNLEQHVKVVPDLLSRRELTTAPDIERLGQLYRHLYDGDDPGGWNLITTYGASNLRDGVTVPDRWSAP